MSPDEREAVIRENVALVKRLARRVHRMLPGSDAGDLVGDGCVGLIRAADSFDRARGCAFERYAARVIVGAMLNGVRAMDPVPERVRREVRQADRERHALAAESGTWPTAAEMEARRPNLRRAQMLAARYTPLSLDGPLPRSESITVDWTSDPARVVAGRTNLRELHAFIGALPIRQQRVLALHYFAQRSMTQVGAEMQISAQRASQLHLAAIARLRRNYAAH